MLYRLISTAATRTQPMPGAEGQGVVDRQLDQLCIGPRRAHEACSGGLAKSQAELDARHGVDHCLVEVFDRFDEMRLPQDHIDIGWLVDGLPDVRRTAIGRDTHGKGWIGLRRTGAEVVRGVTEVPLLPPLAVLGLGLALLAAAWWREGR